MNTETVAKPFQRWSLVVFTVASALIFLHGLDVPLLGPDEPRYSQVAREMFTRGDWITPTLGGFQWFEKPALLYWLQITSYNLFGVSEFSARFGSAMFGFGTLLVMFLMARSWARREDAADSTEHFAPVTLYLGASSLGLLVFSRGASFDIILTFPMAAALVCYFMQDQIATSPFARTVYLTGFYFFCGLALIGKGLIGIVLPLGIVTMFHLFTRSMPPRRVLVSGIWGLVLSAVTASVWYLPVYMANGWRFIDEFFLQHHFARYTSNKYLHPQPFWFFWIVLPLMTFPWLPFFIGAVARAAGRLIHRFRGGESIPGSPLRKFLVAWMLTPLIFFSFSGSKLPGYILPALPAAILLTAEFLSEYTRRSKRWASLIPAMSILTLLAVSAVIAIPLRSWAKHETVKDLVEAGNSAGLSEAQIINLHTISHNLEFYGAGRLVRDEDGRQKRFEGPVEIRSQLERSGTDSVLVIVPLEYRTQLEGDTNLKAKFLKDNGELAIFAVTLAPSASFTGSRSF